MRSGTRIFLGTVVLSFAALTQARAQGASIMTPAGSNNDAISSNGSDPKTWDPKLDAVIAAPANHQVIYEDDDVRVLLVTLRPHQRENPHDHPWPSIMAILDGSLKVGNVDARGDPAPVRPLPPGFVLPAVIRSAPEALHSNYNSDPDKSFRAIRIEYKHGFPKNPSQ